MLFLYLLLFCNVWSFDPKKYDHKKVMWTTSNGGIEEEVYTIHWSTDKNQIIKIALEVKADGWIGFGIAEQTSGTMAGSDVLQGLVTDDGALKIYDRYVLRQPSGGTYFEAPLTDKCNDWNAINGEKADGKTIIEVTRVSNTHDSQDRPIPLSGNVRIILAYSDNQDINTYHGNNRKATFIDFSDPAVKKTGLDDWKNKVNVESFDFLGTWDLTVTEAEAVAQGYKRGVYAQYVDEVTVYTNFQMDLRPMVAKVGPFQILGAEHIINEHTSEFVHHFVLSGYFLNGTQNYAGQVGIYGWAPGIEPFFTQNCGFEVGLESGVDTLVLNTHYDNPEQKTGYMDKSGVRIYYTTDTVPHQCGNLAIGQGNNIPNDNNEIAPGKTKYVYECLDFGKDEDILGWGDHDEITVFYEGLHMHEVGREQWMEIKQGDGDWVKSTSIEFWDFNFQSVQKPMIGEFKLRPGDSLRLTCIYDTLPDSSGKGTRKFGLASQDEMCLNGLVYYPRVPGIETICYYLGPDVPRITRTEEKNTEFVTDFGKPSKNCTTGIFDSSSTGIFDSSSTGIQDLSSTGIQDPSSATSLFTDKLLFIFVFPVYAYYNVQ